MQQQAAESAQSGLTGGGNMREGRVADNACEYFADVGRSVVRFCEKREEGL